MTIRFPCGSCSQPIEVDDEWASKTVACPFCHKTVTAPAESTLGDLGQEPVASPLPDPTLGRPPLPPPPQIGATVEQPNRIALVAMILGVCSIALMIMSHLILASHSLELAELHKALMGAKSFPEQMNAQTKFFETYPGAHRWLVPAFILAIGSGLAIVATIVCGLVGMRRPQRRGMAIAALLIAGLVPVFFCCGGIFGNP